MTLVLLLALPVIAGSVTIWLRSPFGRRWLALATAVAHFCLTLSCWFAMPSSLLGGWLALDELGRVFLTITSVLYLAASCYALGYLTHEPHGAHADQMEGFLFANEPESVFLGCLQLFLGAMTFVAASQHFGLLWVGVEATTLASAPLIYFHRHHRSLEATWKYLLICSVGIALALVGNFLLAVASRGIDQGHASLTVETLLKSATRLDPAWLKTAFLFFLVGYGTKMGLAPMHTWLPDAHSEAPSLVSALLSGALLNCAWLGILRCHGVLTAAGVGDFSNELLMAFGLLSMGFAAVFVMRQPDFKRLLAYSSVEHMGILAFGAGLGADGVSASVYHACNHSLTKAALFLTAGNILAYFHTKETHKISGLLRVAPVTGVLWIAGFLSITGAPPFGTFASEIAILRAALVGGSYLPAALYLGLLVVIFMGLARTMLPMAQGRNHDDHPPQTESWSMIVPNAVLLAGVLVLGLGIPPALRSSFETIGRGFQSSATSKSMATSITPHELQR